MAGRAFKTTSTARHRHRYRFCIQNALDNRVRVYKTAQFVRLIFITALYNRYRCFGGPIKNRLLETDAKRSAAQSWSYSAAGVESGMQTANNYRESPFQCCGMGKKIRKNWFLYQTEDNFFLTKWRHKMILFKEWICPVVPLSASIILCYQILIIKYYICRQMIQDIFKIIPCLKYAFYYRYLFIFEIHHNNKIGFVKIDFA